MSTNLSVRLWLEPKGSLYAQLSFNGGHFDRRFIWRIAKMYFLGLCINYSTDTFDNL